MRSNGQAFKGSYKRMTDQDDDRIMDRKLNSPLSPKLRQDFSGDCRDFVEISHFGNQSTFPFIVTIASYSGKIDVQPLG